MEEQGVLVGHELEFVDLAQGGGLVPCAVVGRLVGQLGQPLVAVVPGVRGVELRPGRYGDAVCDRESGCVYVAAASEDPGDGGDVDAALSGPEAELC